MLESKRRAIIFLTVSLLLAAVAGYLVLKKVTDLGTMQTIYVAAEEIPSRTILSGEYVKTIEIPKGYYNENSHVTNVKEMAGKEVVATIKEGGIITKEILKDISFTFNENNRLVNITSSDKVQIDNKPKVNDHVDIIVSHKFNGEPVTETFMKDLLVYQVGDKSIYVAVKAEDAPKIIHMQNYADSMRVLIANVAQEEQANTEAVKEEATKKEPEKAPEAPAKEPAKQPVQQQPTEKPATEQPAQQTTQPPAS